MMKILRKIQKEIYIYISWGVLVGAVNLGSSWLFMYPCHMKPLYANFLSWVLYNFVSFVTNRTTVFHTAAKTFREFVLEMGFFYASRVFTLLVEEGIIYLLVNVMKLWAMGVKIFTSILVIFLNYYISKTFIFRKVKSDFEEDIEKCQK
jgi:putative flippase GtrA